MEDIKIICVDCGNERIFTVEEQKTFAERTDEFGKPWTIPKRCIPCAKARKQKIQKERGGGYSRN